METTGTSRADRGAVVDAPGVERSAGRAGLAYWQAQLIALAVTIGVVTVVVLLFSLLTGSL